MKLPIFLNDRSGDASERKSRTPMLASLLLLATFFTLTDLIEASPCLQDDSTPTGETTVWSILARDSRLAEPRSLDSYFPFQVPANLEEWEGRKAVAQARLRTILGLAPEPPRTPLNAVISAAIPLDGYSVAKVRFESMPGFFVTGSLYRPLDSDSSEDSDGQAGESGKRPAILSPHGHWSRGRFFYASDEEVQRELDSGAEPFESSARSPLQARCVHLARMGCVVFHYDMLGNADSVQIPAAIAHGFSTQRLHLNAPEAWGLFSVRAESHFQSLMGLQTWNTIRSLDFLETLPDVDTQRMGVTGASGGGTQTFIVSAIDPRVAVSFPAVMVGTAMQGGCVCENCSMLRVDSGNVEFAAMFAPKPLGLSAAQDWTAEMETKGFPELKQLYALYGVEDQVELTSRLEFGHNYNQHGRKAMYSLLARNFGLPDFPERPFQVLRDHEMSWLVKATPAAEGDEAATSEFQPETGEDFEAKLLKWWQSTTEQSWTKILEKLTTDQADADHVLPQWRSKMRGIYLGTQYQIPSNLRWVPVSNSDFSNDIRRVEWLLEDGDTAQLVPVVVYQLQHENAGTFPPQAEEICLYIGDHADGVLDEQGNLKAWARERLDAGQQILCIDLLGQGRFVSGGGFQMDDRWKMTKRESAGYVMGYNLPLVSQRAQDVLQVLAALLPNEEPAGSDGVALTKLKRLDVVAEGEGSPALSLSTLTWDLWGGSKHEVVVDGQTRTILQRIELRGADFRFVDVPSLRDANFLPGAAVIGDLPGLWVLNRVPNVVIDSAADAWREVNRVRAAVGAPLIQLPDNEGN